MSVNDMAFSSFRLNGLTLRNRFIKTAAHEGMTPRGMPTEKLLEHHRRVVQGGVAMTTVAYGGVNADGLTHEDQMVIEERVLPGLKELADAVHKEGGKVSMQLTHCGFFSKSNRYINKRPLSASMVLNKYGLMKGRGLSREMSVKEIEQTTYDFSRATGLLKDIGFDAVEIHMGHGYLLSQFLTPTINKRKDQYGGKPENRMRFPLEVVKAVRKEAGNDFPVICKINMADGFKGGLEMDESLSFAKELERSGADALILSGGFTSKTPFYLLRGDVPLKEMVRAENNKAQKLAMAVFGRQIIKKYEFEENFFLNQAREFRKRLDIPLVYIGGTLSTSGINKVLDEGFELIALGRSLIHDPDFLMKVKEDKDHVSRCNQCNICVGDIESKGVHCPVD